MSREIKFRIWDNQKKEWLGASDNDVMTYYGFHLVGEVMTVQAPPQWALDPHCVVEQNTGLKDKNGKEIYEGDIVEWVDGLWEKHIFEIIWNECRASFQMVEIGQEYPYILQGLSDKMKRYCEVIGNIHENPDLLADN